MADDRLRFILDFVAQTSGLKNAQALAEELGTSLEDAEDAGKAMAAALKVGADKAQRELDDTIDMADKLAAALGPELAAKVNVDEIAGKMRQVGMTTADVEANIDDFRASLTQMADTADRAKARMGDLNTGVQRVGDTTDRSRSVMANFTGNAMQELPGLTGAFAPLNMAIGQFAEYGAEGNISLKNMAAQAGPMAGIGAAIWYANNQLELMKKKDAFRAERVKAYTEVVDDAGDAAANLATKLRELGKIESTTSMNAGNPFAKATIDVTKALDQAGLSVEQYAELVVGGADAVRAWIDAQQAAGNEIPTELYKALGDDIEDYDKAQSNAAVNARFFGGEVATAADKAKRHIADLGREWDKFTGKFDQEDALANAVLAVEGLDDALADIAARLKRGEISDAEAWAESVLAVNSVKGALHDLEAEFGVTSTKFAEGIDVLIDSGQIDEAYAKLIALQRLVEANNAPGARQGEAARNGHAPAIPGRASGGPVSAGKAYVVGENRPELFVPGTSGTILPSVPGGGDTNVTINVSVAPGANLAEAGRQTADALAAFYRSGGQRP